MIAQIERPGRIGGLDELGDMLLQLIGKLVLVVLILSLKVSVKADMEGRFGQSVST